MMTVTPTEQRMMISLTDAANTNDGYYKKIVMSFSGR